MSKIDKVCIVFGAIWLSCGLVASGMFLQARRQVEFKASPVAVVPITMLGGLSLFLCAATPPGILGEDNGNPYVKEIKALRNKLKEREAPTTP